MKLLAITREEFFAAEAEAVARMLDGGYARIHLRKPSATETELRRLIERVPIRYYRRLSLHDHHALAVEYGIGGIHLNSRNPEPPAGFSGIVSRSCHRIGELTLHPALDYLFLSPIYDSISKSGYKAAFTRDELLKAAEKGVIDSRTVALGGIRPEHLSDLAALHFGGAAVLGFAWGDGTISSIERNMKTLLCYNS